MTPLIDSETESEITGGFFDFPSVNKRFASRSGEPARFVYGLGASRPTRVANRIVKLDARGGLRAEHRTFALPHVTPGEPVFVERPGATAEDDGVLLSWCNSELDGSTSLVVLDAASLRLVARLSCPIGLPYGFHGDWFQDSAHRKDPTSRG